MTVEPLPVEVLPTPGEAELRAAGLALGVAFGGELDTFRPHAHEARLAAAMNQQRRHDFLVGRLAARRALEALAVPPAPVLVARQRPLFPRPAIGSISHACGVGVALATLRDVAGIGVDVELRRLSARAARGVLNPDELAWTLRADSETARAARATAVFSAKESVFKALPAAAQVSLRWRDIAITPRGSGFTARVQGAGWIGGQWRCNGSGVLTWATAR